MSKFKENKVLLLISFCAYPVFVVQGVRSGSDLLLSIVSSLAGAFMVWITFGMLYELQKEHGIFNPILKWLRR